MSAPLKTREILALIPLAWGEDALDMTLGAAQRVAADAGLGFAALLLGNAGAEEGARRAAVAGAARICLAAHAGLALDAEPAALALAGADAVRRQPEAAQRLLLVPPGADGEELAAHLASALHAQPLGRCSALRWTVEGLQAERATWGGRLRLGMTQATGCAVACLRLGKAEAAASAEPPCERLELDTVLPAPLAVEVSISGQRLPPVESARIVVSGGRGVNEQGFALLAELAERLDGSLGGSLPAVDAGMVPVVRQVGVSGKFVSPDIYLAVGISGTPQHLAGISPDTRIVAINKDPAAEIFKVASVGVVGDWEQVLPELLRVVGEGRIAS